MVGQWWTRCTLTATSTNNYIRVKHRRVHRWRTLIRNNSDYDLITTNAPNSIQNFRDQRLCKGKGEQNMRNIQVDPYSSVLEYTHLFKMQQEKLNSHFISVFNLKDLFIFFFLPHNWMEVMINIYIGLGQNENYLTYICACNVKWKEKR